MIRIPENVVFSRKEIQLWRVRLNDLRARGWHSVWMFVMGFTFIFIPFPVRGATTFGIPEILRNALVSQGVSVKAIHEISRKKSIVDIDIILKNVTHKETVANYKGFLDKKTLVAAERYLEKHKYLFSVVEKVYQVPREIIVAILMVETSLGKQKGKYPVTQVFVSLASLMDKKIRRLVCLSAAKKGENIQSKRFKKKVSRKTRWGFKELICLLRLSEKGEIDLNHVKGSWAGAFGIPQFIPTSYKQYGVDWDADGHVCLDQHPDAIASVAYYLKAHGWRKGMGMPKALKVIKQYNHSHPYAATILEMAKRLKKTRYPKSVCSNHGGGLMLERATGLEPATPSLGSLCSTN